MGEDLAEEALRIAIVGAGNFTRRRHLPNLLAIPGVRVVSVANRSLDSSRRVAEEFGIVRASDDWRDVIQADDVDAVLVGTAPNLHHQIVMAAFEARKHVLCQTRMATSLAEAQEMAWKAKETGRKAMLVRSNAYGLARRYVKHLLDTDFVGNVRQVFAHYLVANYVDSSAPLHRRQDHRDFGVINPMALGIYWDVLRSWFGDAARVLAWGKTFTPMRADGEGGPPIEVAMPDAVTVVSEQLNGAVITCMQSGVAPFGQERIEIYGERGTLVCLADGKLLGGRVGDSGLTPLPIPPDYRDSWHVEEDFVRLVGDRPVDDFLTFEDGVRNIEYLEATRLSIEQGSWVDLPLRSAPR